jgi:alkylhydroperoxidase family enzyme
LARRLGATDEQIGRLAHGDLVGMEESWAAACRVAESMTTRGGRISTAEYEALAAHWNQGEIVEIVAVVGLFNYFNRFANALDIPPTK